MGCQVLSGKVALANSSACYIHDICRTHDANLIYLATQTRLEEAYDILLQDSMTWKIIHCLLTRKEFDIFKGYVFRRCYHFLRGAGPSLWGGQILVFFVPPKHFGISFTHTGFFLCRQRSSNNFRMKKGFSTGTHHLQVVLFLGKIYRSLKWFEIQLHCIHVSRRKYRGCRIV